MRNADMALYRAKSDGKGVHRFFEAEMDRQAQKRRDMERNLRQAFANGEFDLHRGLNITTTAEGVETLDQLDWLRAEGCNEVQGFLFSAARPANEIAALLAGFSARGSKAA